MRFLVVKHVPEEGLGLIAPWCAEAGIAVEVVELGQGEPLPSPVGYQAVWVMGGPMNVDQEAEYPWLVGEKRWIRQVVQDYQIPYIGVCLGAQLLAEALGGRVGAMPRPEVGLTPVYLTPCAQDHPLLRGLPTPFVALHWHGQEVQALPPQAKRLASSDLCQVQAFSVGDWALGLQFHLEADAATVRDWCRLPDYADDFIQAMGATGAQALVAKMDEESPRMTQVARQLFANICAMVERRWRA
ncbi:MAG: type 1 glutamine amidotransferase [Gloeomargarita sp. SKYBB_i_bin120]|nr:type 1 glutamine amidotransferase [Gloeomargarita sp. SKYG98]MCS7292258.1 type 1 glutamine amidotransferase [Gloeomargarita sp. SKYB120]MDW8177819.1 type 1 glutamine amidotransferase [Gloeomargarita sp. SKYBB_i_bin120]